jgi:cation-transporting ATPase E
MNEETGSDLNQKFSAGGLTGEQVKERQKAGLVNTVPAYRSKTTGQIIAGNLFTFFNLINVLIFFLILLTGQYINTLFMGVILINTLIGMIQEIRAKLAIDRLSILTAASVTVIRDGIEQQIPLAGIVLDDLTVLMPGNQITRTGNG